MPPFLQGRSTPLGEAWALQVTPVPTTPDGHTWQTTPLRYQVALLVFVGGTGGPGRPESRPGHSARSDRLWVGVRTWPQVVLLLARQPPWKTPPSYPLEN